MCQAYGFFLSTAHSQRLVNVKSRLKQAPRYSTLDRDLIEYQERQLFEYFVVVSLHKKQAGAAYVPELTQQFPLKVREAGAMGCLGTATFWLSAWMRGGEAVWERHEV